MYADSKSRTLHKKKLLKDLHYLASGEKRFFVLERIRCRALAKKQGGRWQHGGVDVARNLISPPTWGILAWIEQVKEHRTIMLAQGRFDCAACGKQGRDSFLVYVPWRPLKDLSDVEFYCVECAPENERGKVLLKSMQV